MAVTARLVTQHSDAEVLSAGQTLGRYELLSQVARGGMGQVWVARLRGARGFQKLVAIKTLLPELRDDARIEQMLLEEARIASLIQHSNVVQTTELGEHRGYLYLVMEWIHGESLGFVLKRAEERGRIPLPITVNLMGQACRGLHAAHELTSDLGVHLGVVHRDVSPHNVLVTHSGVVKLVDFGIAKAMKEEASFTANGEVKGKYAYMSPEQVLGDEVDRRADVFSLGITFYLMATGRHPFKLGEKGNVIRALTNDVPARPPSDFVPDFPPALEAVLLKALAKAPADRHQSAEAMRVALDAALPEAFAPRFEAQVKEYLARVMGDRAQARREALRRLQLAADERLVAELGSGLLPPPASQSAGSLRAIMVDTQAVALEALPPAPRLSEMPTQPGVRLRRRTRYAAGFAALALGVLAVTAEHMHAQTSAAAAPPMAVELPVAAPAPSPTEVPVIASAAPTEIAVPAATDVAPNANAPAPNPSPRTALKGHQPSNEAVATRAPKRARKSLVALESPAVNAADAAK